MVRLGRLWKVVAAVTPVHPVCSLASDVVCTQGRSWVSPQGLPLEVKLSCYGYPFQIKGPSCITLGLVVACVQI